MTRATQIEFLTAFPVIPERSYVNYYQDITHVTARETFGTCRECGRDVPGGHESMKCYLCRSTNEEWRDAD